MINNGIAGPGDCLLSLDQFQGRFLVKCCSNHHYDTESKTMF